jgi:electron transport complex protein RnfD
MAKKLMIFPSVRSKFVTEKGMKIMYQTLLVLAAVMVLQNWYLYSFMHGVKLILMALLAVVATRETEILFYSHDMDIDRATAKELIVKSYPNITGLLFALMLPVGTPLWLVIIGAVLATSIGKLIFGGYHHMVFHTSLVGFLFVTIGWGGLAVDAEFVTSFDNFLLELLFDHPFFNETLSLGNLFVPGESLLALNTSVGTYSTLQLALGTVPGVLGSGIVILGMFGYLVYKKAINYILPTTMIITLLVTTFIIALVNDYSLVEYPLYHLFGGMFLFVVVFLASDPITTPIPTSGKIVYGVLAALITVLVRNGDEFAKGSYIQGVVFAVLFMSMLTPMLNVELSKKRKIKGDKVPKKKVGAEVE